jgi:restriction system protein
MARRGLLAELAHQSRVQARERERAERAEVREYNAAVRRAEQARRAAERAQAQSERAAEAERKQFEKEARDAHIAEMEAEVEERNLRLAEIYSELDSLLASTLGVDDHVDLESLRVTVNHPPFDRQELEIPKTPPAFPPDPREPIFVNPDPPKGFAALFGKEKKHAAAIAKAQAAHVNALVEWRADLDRISARRQRALEAHSIAEQERLTALEEARARYARECAARETAANESNRQVDELIANLAYGTPEAVQEYVSIVLSNSVYPDHFPVTHTFEFDPSSAELRLRVCVPGPSSIPEIKAYKYTKSTDEISETGLSQKVCRDRYAGAVHQVALRSLHEVFEADRRGIVGTISLEVGTQTIDPATGRHTYIPFVVVGVERSMFVEFNLAAVVPPLTLERLGASVSKNPHSLVPAETSGIRRS